MGRTAEIIDVHMHCFTSREHGPQLRRDLELLRREGVRHLCVVGLVNTHLDRKAIWNLIPEYVDNRGNADFNEADDLQALSLLSEGCIVPLVDTRHLYGNVERELSGYLARGFRGIKGIYLPAGNDLNVVGVPDSFGLSYNEYRRREWEIFRFAADNGLPLLYHMDSRRYGDVMTSFLDDFPNLRVNFAHLGVGRKSFGRILDRYPNVYTDIAGLLPHIRRSPEGYRDFIMHYRDRVCFATDAMLYQATTLLEYKKMVRELRLPEEVEHRFFSANARKFLGAALSVDEAVDPDRHLPPPCLSARWDIV